ncbi:SDR family oxidoreductase [soil metagenome]
MSGPSFDLSGGVAIVTGASGGIGYAVAKGLAAAGADVGCIDRTDGRLKELVEEIADGGRKAFAVTADVSDFGAMHAAIASVESELGPIRYAANCAGINTSVPAMDMTREKWTETIEANLTGTFASCQAEGKAMARAGGGTIVNIGSVSAMIANRGLTQAHYNASKAGVVHLSTTLALEWADLGIRVNTVSPGYTKTPMATHPDVWEHVKAFAKDIPLKRWAEPEEMVGPIVFLLSEASSYCTGSNLVVDGGSIYW